MPNPVHIKIQDRKGKVNQDEVTIHTEQCQEAVWTSDDGRCLIIFANSPFNDSVFVCPDRGSVTSGLAAVTDCTKKKYKYTVIGPEGLNDPIIVIDK